MHIRQSLVLKNPVNELGAGVTGKVEPQDGGVRGAKREAGSPKPRHKHPPVRACVNWTDPANNSTARCLP